MTENDKVGAGPPVVVVSYSHGKSQSESKETKSITPDFPASILKKPSSSRALLQQDSASHLSSTRSNHRKGPTTQFRQRGTFYRPVYEMFLCYGSEEFFDC